MGWDHKTQRIRQQMLDLMIAGRDPGFLGDYMTDNTLMRALAHLVATDGNFSRLLRCTSGGVLRTILEDAAGDVLAIESDGDLNVRLKDYLGNALTSILAGALKVGPYADSVVPAVAVLITTTVGEVIHNLSAGGGTSLVLRLSAVAGDCSVEIQDPGGANIRGPWGLAPGTVLTMGLDGADFKLAITSLPSGTADRYVTVEEWT